MAIYNAYDVVVVPFPFTDKQADKKRPALVLSDKDFNTKSDNCVLAMITSQRNPDWAFDVPIGSLQKTGLKSPSKVRMKIFTLDSSFILRKLGGLSKKDRERVFLSLQKLFPLT
jgi:mRNA interferase MazF